MQRLLNAQGFSLIRVFAVLLVITLAAGCGSGDSGLSEFDQMQADKSNALESLKSKGAKAAEKSYPQGNAWSIDFSGQTITAETFDQLQNVGYVSELNFSGSTLNDALVPRLNEEGVRAVLIKLDLSKTEVSDAGLAQLKDLNLLRELVLTGSKVTADGVSKFQSARQSNPNIPQMFKNVAVKM